MTWMQQNLGIRLDKFRVWMFMLSRQMKLYENWQRQPACEKVNPEISVFEGRVVSGDQFVADKALKNQIIERTNGWCTEMEGTAVGQAAHLNKIPYLIIRAISDKADDSAQVDYPTFERQAILHSVKLVEELLLML